MCCARLDPKPEKTQKFRCSPSQRNFPSSAPSDWRYVPSNLNPADHGTRGLKSTDITVKWTKGPKFLTENAQNWPTRPNSSSSDYVCACASAKYPPVLLDVRRFSSWLRLFKTAAQVIRFVRRLRSRNSDTGLITADFQLARLLLIRQSQAESFSSTLAHLKCNLRPSPQDKLLPYNPVLDDQGILRSAGRLKYAPLPESTRLPIILDAKNPLVKLLVEHSENIQPFMAPLPPFRYPSPDAPFPFAQTGIDLFGPFFIVNGKKLEKHYAIIFNCLVTRACHLESCPFMTSDSFLNAFRRFVARRGQPQLLRSDNGSNFVGARRELQQSLNDSIKNVRENFPESIEMRWDLNPPFAPHFGGVWERMIQTAKRTLLIILGSKKLTLDFFQTILTETELMLNSRPLTHVADQPDNEEPLTSNHFLLHRPYANLPPGIFNDTEEPLSFKSWKDVQKVMNHFWDRFLKEYLPTLHHRSKWNQDQHPLQVGDIVWVLKDLTPRGIWPLGRIVSLHPGPDGITRVCSVRTAYGTFERPAVSLSRVFAP